MKNLLIDLVWWHLHSLGVFAPTVQDVSAARKAGGLLPVYDAWFGECVRLFMLQGYLRQEHAQLCVCGAPARVASELWREWEIARSRWSSNEDLAASQALLDVTLRALPDILTGKKTATEVMFPRSSLSLVENTYKNNPVSEFFNAVLASQVATYARQRCQPASGPGLKLLEIGAGTGATSIVVLRTLAERGIPVGQYCYTDISKAFLNHAQDTYGHAYPFLTYRTLNIETPPTDQGFELADYDIVIAANVLHATRNIRRTLRNTKALLRSGGFLFMNEMTSNNLFNHLTFGLLEGWWRYEDPEVRLAGSPGLSVESWRQVLESERYAAVTFPCPEASDLGGQIIVATSDGVVRVPTATAAPTRAATTAVESPRADSPSERPAAAAADAPATADSVGALIVAELAKSLRIERTRIRPQEPFSSYGLDSILAIELTRKLSEEFRLDLDVTTMFEHSNVDALTEHIVSELALSSGRPGSTSSSVALTTPMAPATPRAAASEASTPRRSTHDLVEDVVLTVLAESLRIERARVQRQEPFSSYGLDSILAVNIARVINDKLGIDLDITALFEHGTTSQLCDFIVQAHAGQLVSSLSRAIPVVPSELAGDDASASEHLSSIAAGHADSRDSAGAEGFAIIGMSGRFPQAADVDAFWHGLEQGRCCITQPPLEREDWKVHADAVRGSPEHAHVWGAFVEGIDEFDPLFFGISMTEARQMTPEQRLMLMHAWNALEDAGYAPRELSGEPTGVFIATGPSEYQPESDISPAASSAGMLSPPLASMIPNRISYFLNLHGPSEYCETTCSSSLVALHRALQSLACGECAAAIVGAVQLIQSPAGFASMAAVGMLSPDGQVRPFQDNAAGTVRSEGVGAIVIKPLAAAIDAGDAIYAVIRGTGVAHGGRGVSFTAPNIRGMKAAIQQAYRAAGCDPTTTTYIEAHGMSTLLTDGAEMAALSSSFGAPMPAAEAGAPDAPIYVGTLKPSIGHTEVFSGMAALMKTVMALRHGLIPGIARFGRASERFSLAGSRLKLATENTPWLRQVGALGEPLPRRASINSFGIGGVNAHAVLEEYMPAEPRPGMGAAVSAPQVIVLSARDEKALTDRAARLLRWMEQSNNVELADLAYTLQVGREEMDCRLAFVARTREDVLTTLAQFCSDDPARRQDMKVALNSEPRQDVVELFSAKTGEAILKALFAEGKLEAIARYWTKGATLEWSALRRGAKCKRLRLPGYPFKRLHCWAPPSNARAREDAPRLQARANNDVAVGPEEFVTSLIASVLGLAREDIDKTRPLNLYGLNSLLLVTVLNHIRSAFPAFQPSALQAHDTLESVIMRLSNVAPMIGSASASSRRWQYPELVHLNERTQGQPVFWIHGALGSVETFQSIARRSERPFYAIQARGFMTKHAPIEGIGAMASHYLDIIRSVQAEGPYDLGGFCLGGVISYEMARQLQLQGQRVRSIVMVDSPDNTGLMQAVANSDFSPRSAALQVANSLLWPANEKDLNKVVRRLIHQDDIDGALTGDQVIARLAELAVQRGLPMAPEAIVEFIKRNLDVQLAYRVAEYVIRPLPEPDAVQGTYFRNRRGLFFGELGSYFKVAGESFSLDHVVYWQDWQRELKRLRIVDIEAANHMTIMYEDEPLRAIVEVCKDVYAARAMSIHE